MLWSRINVAVVSHASQDWEPTRQDQKVAHCDLAHLPDIACRYNAKNSGGKVKIKVSPPPEEQEKLKRMILGEDGAQVLTQVMTNIDARRMQATVAQDLDRIKNLIEDPDRRREAFYALRSDIVDGNADRVPERVQILGQKKSKKSMGGAEPADELMANATVSIMDQVQLNKVKKIVQSESEDNDTAIALLDELIDETETDLYLGSRYLAVDNIYKVSRGP